jgi:dTDP-glucose pyrophosphorylase/CBS domain-containing protein
MRVYFLDKDETMSTTKRKQWQKTLIGPQTSIQEAIRNIDESALQIAVVIDCDGMLLGTVTDGDIRRALLRGIDLSQPVETIMSRTPLVITREIGRKIAQVLMGTNKINQLPVVDEKRRVVGLYVWEETNEYATRENMMVLMAGGFGRRMMPHTEDLPKPMLKVAGKPMLEHIIERAKSEGFHNFTISTHYLGHVIEEYFGDGGHWGVNIQYLREKSPLGTAGALGLMNPRPDLPFIVTNGDVLTDIRYGDILDFHLHYQADATMAIRKHEWQHPFGTVITDGIKIKEFEEKPVHKTNVNAGIYILNPSALECLAPNEACDMPSLFIHLQQAGNTVIAYPMHEPWMDVGRPEDLRRANTLAA